MKCWKWAALYFLLTGIAACGSAPVEERHYSLRLDALSDTDYSTQPVAGSAETLYVTSVRLPEYLRSNNLVMQVGDNEILPARRHFWAEPLAESIKSVLEHDLGQHLEGVAVARGKADDGCSLDVEFERFHATDNARVVSSGHYRLQHGDGHIERSFDTSRALPEGGYGNAVGELRKSVDVLAAILASELDDGLVCKASTAEAEPGT